MEDQTTALKPYPTLKQTWGLLGILLLITVSVYAFFFLLTMAMKSTDLQQTFKNPWFLLLLYSLQFALIIGIAFLLKRRREPTHQISWKGVSLGEAALIAVVTVGLSFLIDPITDLIPMPDFFKKLIMDLLSDRSLPTVLMLVVAAPLGEELLFRGVVLDGLLKNYSPKRAIIWSAVFFGLVHLNPWQFIGALGLGIFMGWVFWRTGSLLATIFIHFVANGSSVLLGALLVPDPQQWLTTRQLVGNDLLYCGLLAVNLLIVIGAVRMLQKLWEKKQETHLA